MSSYLLLPYFPSLSFLLADAAEVGQAKSTTAAAHDGTTATTVGHHDSTVQRHQVQGGALATLELQCGSAGIR